MRVHSLLRLSPQLFFFMRAVERAEGEIREGQRHYGKHQKTLVIRAYIPVMAQFIRIDSKE